jgi:hypothetical protein
MKIRCPICKGNGGVEPTFGSGCVALPIYTHANSSKICPGCGGTGMQEELCGSNQINYDFDPESTTCQYCSAYKNKQEIRKDEREKVLDKVNAKNQYNDYGPYLLAMILINLFGVIMTSLAASLDTGKLTFDVVKTTVTCAILSTGITIFAIVCWISNKNHINVETTS